MRLRSWGMIAAAALVAVPLQAQFVEDALRLGTPGIGVGARALGMGNAYTGVASDFTAMYWNPAGLAQAQFSEFSIGLSHLNFRNESSFFGSNESYSNNATNLNSLGFVLPVPVRRGSLVFGLGYSRGAHFTTGLSFEGFNPNSSIIQYWAPHDQPYPSDITMAEELGLAIADTNTGRFNSPIRNRVTQLGTVLESGGINNWSVAGAVEISPKVYAGLTLNYLAGSYGYDRTYSEIDRARNYETFPFDFDRLTVEDFVDGDISGVNAKLGILLSEPERYRVGITIKTPSSLHIKEDFGTTANAYFDDGSVLPSDGPWRSFSSGEYDVITPWVFSGGASFFVQDLVLSGDIEYTDWTQLEFSDATPEVLSLNKDIKRLFRETLNVRVGAEYAFRHSGLRLRGGFIYNPSPFTDDPSSFDQKYITAGLGVPLGEAAMLDVAYARGMWKTYISNYDASSLVDEEITTNNVIVTFSFRF